MASRRDLKKDIQVVSGQFILDAVEVAQSADSDVQDEIIKIISEVAVMHNDLIARVNHVDGKNNPKILKAYFKDIVISLLKGSDEAYTKLAKYLPA